LKSAKNNHAVIHAEHEELALKGPSLVLLLKDVLEKGADFRFQAKGPSMTPFIKDGDVVTISPLGGNRLKTGEVAAFTSPRTGGLYVHRLIETKGEVYFFQGDRLSETDGPVSHENIHGKVTRVERDGKTVYFGSGPERRLIAALAKRKLLMVLLVPIWHIVRPFIRFAQFVFCRHKSRNSTISDCGESVAIRK
jgi:hypothetical protein